MQCINDILGLFNGPTCCSATSLAIAAFVAGVFFAFVLCKLVRPCSCAKNAKTARRKKEDRPFEKRKPHPAPADGSVEIYVGNLSYDLTDDLLRKEFEAYGKVNSVRIVTHRQTGRSKGFGFVHMPDRAEAEKAVKNLNDKDILGRKLRCNEAKNLI